MWSINLKFSIMAEKKRYSDEELEEFRAIINEKLKLAYNDYNQMMKQLMNADGNDVDDTSPTYKVLEEGSATQSKEELVRLPSCASRTRPMASTASRENSFRKSVSALCPMPPSACNRK